MVLARSTLPGAVYDPRMFVSPARTPMRPPQVVAGLNNLDNAAPRFCEVKCNVFVFFEEAALNPKSKRRLRTLTNSSML